MVGEWKDWDASENVKRPPELEKNDDVEYILKDGYSGKASVGELVWTSMPSDKRDFEIVKYRSIANIVKFLGLIKQNGYEVKDYKTDNNTLTVTIDLEI